LFRSFFEIRQLNYQCVISRSSIQARMNAYLLAEVGELIGLTVTQGRERTLSGVVAGETRPYFLHDVEIQIGEWRRPVLVGFMPDLSLNGHGLLGQSGFFDLFAFVKFERSQGIIELGPLLQPGATA
jgi:hypothetical protein